MKPLSPLEPETTAIKDPRRRIKRSTRTALVVIALAITSSLLLWSVPGGPHGRDAYLWLTVGAFAVLASALAATVDRMWSPIGSATREAATVALILAIVHVSLVFLPLLLFLLLAARSPSASNEDSGSGIDCGLPGCGGCDCGDGGCGGPDCGGCGCGDCGGDCGCGGCDTGCSDAISQAGLVGVVTTPGRPETLRPTKGRAQRWAHHPDTPAYAADVYQWGNARLCIGCFTTFPLLLITVAWLSWTPVSIAWLPTLLTGAGLAALQAVSTLGLARWKAVKIAVKAALGVGLGLSTVAIAVSPWPAWLQACALLLLVALAYASAIPRRRRMAHPS